MKFILQHYNSFILSVYGFAENAMTHKAVSLCLSEHLHDTCTLTINTQSYTEMSF